MGETMTYAAAGIPDPAPCPAWCTSTHAGSYTVTRHAAIMHGAERIGGIVLAGGHAVTVHLNWIERFDDGAWQPLADEDVTILLDVGMDRIALQATSRNMAGLAAVAQLISPETGDRIRQAAGLLEETRQVRQTSPDGAR